MKTTRRTFLAAAGTAPLLARSATAADRRGDWNPIVSENLHNVEYETLRWLKQLGLKHAVFQGTDHVDASGKGYWTKDDVLYHKHKCDAAGIELVSMMIPIGLYTSARFGRPGRDEEIENVIRTIQATGEAGVRTMEWRFWPDFYWDHRVGYYRLEGRGGASLKAFDYSRVADRGPFPEVGEVSESEMWERFLYFTKPIVEAAEKADVQLTMHPNDPPVRNMRGAARIFHHTDELRRLLREVPSRYNGITFCQGTITEMGVNVLQDIHYFATRDRIKLVHFRSVRGTVPKYREVFVDEGDIDMLEAMKAYRDAGFNGPFVSDHTPRVEGDSGWGHIGRTFTHGYIRGLVQAVKGRDS